MQDILTDVILTTFEIVPCRLLIGVIQMKTYGKGFLLLFLKHIIFITNLGNYSP